MTDRPSTLWEQIYYTKQISTRPEGIQTPADSAPELDASITVGSRAEIGSRLTLIEQKKSRNYISNLQFIYLLIILHYAKINNVFSIKFKKIKLLLTIFY